MSSLSYPSAPSDDAKHTLYRTGQQVRIVASPGDYYGAYNGRVGTYVRRVGGNRVGSTYHLVQVQQPGPVGPRMNLVRCSEVAAVVAAEEETKAQGVKAEAAETPAASPLDDRRVAAAMFAHRLMGNDTDLDALVGLAEWVLGDRTVDDKGTTGTVAAKPQVSEGPAAPDRAQLIADRVAAREAVRNDLRITDCDGDSFTIRTEELAAEGVAMLSSEDENIYLTPKNIDDMIEWLTALRVTTRA